MAWVSLFVDILTDRSGRLSAACSVVCLAPPRLGVLGEMGSVEWDGAESWETSARNGKYVQHPSGIGMGWMGMVRPLHLLGFGGASALHFRLIGIGLLDAPPFVGEGG